MVQGFGVLFIRILYIGIIEVGCYLMNDSGKCHFGPLLDNQAIAIEEYKMDSQRRS